MHDYWFGEAGGELRAGVGYQVATIAASYGLASRTTLRTCFPVSKAPERRRTQRLRPAPIPKWDA